MEQGNKNEKNQKNEKVSNKAKTNKTRYIIVFIVGLIAAIIAYVMFRGSYLETLEIGENYIGVFWQNVQYVSTTLIINFVIIMK